ncbi:redoxin domain-containing protein [Rudanella paleaurantiibacter]|uniref:Redoxin domain-containing protein n=1 Tax=Rudanella paleaurantiibacter TaxID=2614655 RepID=A0A7J5U4H7_9BACT|nr:thioredoxin family protein [Rudanella paleaurantiibacter]KAB7731935.1 redoxin domain-containing protein [Rudanella paleaurantiibacter]
MKKIVGLVLLASIVAALGVAQAQTSVGKGYAVGDAVTDFQVRNMDNKLISLADYRSQAGVVVVFMANHCPFAKAYEDRLMAIHGRFAAQGYPVLAIQTSDPAIYPEDAFEVVQTRARERSFSFVYTLDETQSVARSFGATRTPQVFLLKRVANGFVVQYIGAIDDNPQDAAGVQKRYLEEALVSLVAGRPVPTPATRPIGCAVKWKN